jgi:hypothetical protein
VTRLNDGLPTTSGWEGGPGAAAGLGERRGEPEPERPSGRSGGARRVATSVAARREPTGRLSRGSLSLDDGQPTSGPGGRGRGEGTTNPMGVSGRNTPQGSGKRKPSGSWETAEAERSGCGNPRRGGRSNQGESAASDGRHEVDSLGWEHRRGGEPQGRTDRGKAGRVVSPARRREETRARSSRVSERPRVVSTPGGNTTGGRIGGRRQGPRREARRT